MAAPRSEAATPTLAPFSGEEIERYARHIVLADIGGPGQQKLKAARVLVVGAGGLGAPVICYLAAAGIGTLGIIDDDCVSLSNLQRQIIHDTPALGLSKTESARATVTRLNPHVKTELHPERLTEGNARRLVASYDVVVDCSDNFATRYALSDACFFERRPLVLGAVGQFDGSITTLRPFERAPDGNPNPTYRCLFPEAPPDGLLPTCAETGVLGALTGVIGSLQALEVIKEIVGIGQGLVGRLILHDARAVRFETIEYRWDPGNPLNGVEPVPMKQEEMA